MDQRRGLDHCTIVAYHWGAFGWERLQVNDVQTRIIGVVQIITTDLVTSALFVSKARETNITFLKRSKLSKKIKPRGRVGSMPPGPFVVTSKY